MYEKFLKRFIDIILSLTLLPIFLVLFIPISIIIKLEDGGRVFYCGKRVGKGQKEYKMFKFRSMKENSSDIRNNDGSTYNSSNDRRVTRVGKVLRKLSLDEVPQIVNVLIGDMSFIGPRPSPLGNEKLYSKEYLKKFTVRPGITGYNQAYFRNNATVLEKQKNDLYYIENISFFLDMKIIIVTAYKVFKREGINNSQG